MSSAIFKDKKIKEAIQTKGYAVVQLIGEEEVYSLLKFYNEHSMNLDGKFFTTSWSDDTQYRISTSDRISATIEGKLEKILNDFHILYSSFIIKKSDPDHRIGIHADWQFVEEPMQRAYNIWMPLTDVNSDNAALQVIPGSHRKTKSPRGPNYAFGSSTPNWWLRAKLKTIPLKAGEAIIYDCRLLHGSTKNQSGQTRIVASSLIVAAEAQIKHYYFDPENDQTYKEYDVERDFYLKDCNFMNESGKWKLSEQLMAAK